MKSYDSTMGKLKMRKICFGDLPSTVFEACTGSEACERIRQGIAMAREHKLRGEKYTFYELNCAACIVAVLTHAAEYYLERFHQNYYYTRIHGGNRVQISNYLAQLRERRNNLFEPISAIDKVSSWGINAFAKPLIYFLFRLYIRMLCWVVAVTIFGNAAFLIGFGLNGFWMFKEACRVALNMISFAPPICLPLSLLRDRAFTRHNGTMLQEFFNECSITYGETY